MEEDNSIINIDTESISVQWTISVTQITAEIENHEIQDSTIQTIQNSILLKLLNWFNDYSSKIIPNSKFNK